VATVSRNSFRVVAENYLRLTAW